MTFLQNAWYVSCLSDELSYGPLARTILNERVVMFRGEDGTCAALEDRCPHRFVRLSGGKVQGNAVECPYHGLRFDRQGACILQPFETGEPAPHNRVRAYPVAERYGYVWLWTGDPAAADPSLLPPLDILEDETLRNLYGYLYVEGNYQLIADNVLDLTHVDYIHPTARGAEGYHHYEKKVEQHGDTVTMWLWKNNSTPNTFQHGLWGSASPKADAYSHMHWYAPSHLLLDNGMQEIGEPEGSELRTPSVHLLTPETETTTHYFWTIGRNVRRDDKDLDELLLTTLQTVFSTQDKPMIEEQQETMGAETDIMACRPVILSSDAAAIRARRILQKRIRAEEAGETGDSRSASEQKRREPA